MYLPTSQSDGDNNPIEIPSSKVKLAYVKLTEEIYISSRDTEENIVWTAIHIL